MPWFARNWWLLAVLFAVAFTLYANWQRRDPVRPLLADFPMIEPVAPGDTAIYYMKYEVLRPECTVNSSTFIVKLKVQDREYAINQHGGIDVDRSAGEHEQTMPFEIPRYAPPGIGEMWLEFEYVCEDWLGMSWTIPNDKRRRVIEILPGGEHGV